MRYPRINYLQSYTNLRTQQMSFHEFMELINAVYEFGHQRGTLHGIDICKADIEAQVQESMGSTNTLGIYDDITSPKGH